MPKRPIATIRVETIQRLMAEDEDFRWEFAADGIDSAVVKQRLGLRCNARSPDREQRECATDELEAVAGALEEWSRYVAQSHPQEPRRKRIF